MKYNEVYSEQFEDRIIQLDSPEKAIRDSHAILILTEWDEFKTLPYA
jgi:UDP-glucose 6-dehydrogenase